MSRPQNSCPTLIQLQKQPIRAPKSKKCPEIKKKQISELTETYKIKVEQLHEQTQKTDLGPYPNPKYSPLGPQKVKNDLKIKSKSKELKELHEQTHKQFLNPTLTPKIAYLGPNQIFLGYMQSSRTVLGFTHVVEQLLFSIVPSLQTLDFDWIMGSFFTFWGPNGVILGPGQG